MKKLSDRRLAVLAFIQERVTRQGHPPTLAEIASACGLSARSAARKHVVALEQAGLIEIAPGQARGARPPRAKTRDGLVGESNMFEITACDISTLNDSDLRELVARLCNANFAAKGHPSHYVTWGGDQRAADGGIDVRVKAPSLITHDAGFMRSVTGYQVKAMPMPRSAIQKEMRPGGMLRNSIRNIVLKGGAYIIVSSESASDTMQEDRRSAMLDTIATMQGSDSAFLDFYDARRIADWTNRHPGVVAWVRQRLGRPLQGWRPFGQWVESRGAKEHALVEDTSPRLADPTDKEQHRYSLKEGIQFVRILLRKGGKSVRIAGLSGVGKTRFAQALFEEKDVKNAIDPSLAVYCDASDEPMPTPQALMDELVAEQRRVILVVDNCSSELHAKLTARCSNSATVSLLTIEYDIREDTPNETSVFRLEPASPSLITEVIRQQFPHISQVDAETITRFSEGNSRVAIALAGTVGKQQSLGRLNDESLFNRLFWQKHDKSDALLRAARACSLLYSFDGENEGNELPRLAALCDMGVLALHGEVTTLLQRGLAQKRGVWRAVLPHAIATRLAKQALSLIPYPYIAAEFVEGKGRLLRSFSRRLGHLHDSEEAQSIVRKWLTDGELLGDVANLTESLLEVLRNVAPVDPGAVLRAIERAATGDKAAQFLSIENPGRGVITRLLRSIAYDKAYFERSLSVLVQFAREEPIENRSQRTDELIKSMFPIYLSGTHATKEQRATWIRENLDSAEQGNRDLAVQCLESALEAGHFTSSYSFDFGAKSRDYGYTPRRGAETAAWFEPFVTLAVEYGVRDSALGERIRTLLANKFRSLWSRARQYEQLENAVEQLVSRGWAKGWLAIRQTQRFEKDKMTPEVSQRLAHLEQRARPTTLVDETSAVVLTHFTGGLDITDGDDTDGLRPYERAERRAEDLGRAVAADNDSLQTLLPSLVENRQGRQFRFGFGLAAGADRREELWQMLVTAFESTDRDGRDVRVLLGFLSFLHDADRALFERLLDNALENKSLSEWLPVLQSSAQLDDRGCDRLMRSLERGVAQADKYQYLGYGRVSDNLSDAEMARLARAIASKDGGLLVTTEMLSLYLHDRQPGPEVAKLVREILPLAPTVAQRHQQIDYSLKLLVEKCMTGPDGEASAKSMLRTLSAGFAEYRLSSYDFEEVIASLFVAHPLAALDELIDASDGQTHGLIQRLAIEGAREKSLLDEVPTATLLSWCRDGDSNRWALLAGAVSAFTEDGDKTPAWTDIAVELIRQSPEPLAVIRVLANRLAPMSWSGSRASIMSARLPLLDSLEPLLNDTGRAEISTFREGFERQIERVRAWEDEDDRRDNSFE